MIPNVNIQQINGVYCLTFPNGKRYVGKAVQKRGNGIYKRWSRYKNYDCKLQPKLYNALIKYKIENVKFEMVLCTNDHERASKIEKQLIALWGTYKIEYGYNTTLGGESGNMGIIPWNKGKKGSMKLWHTGSPRSEKTRELIRIANTGRVQSKETKEKRSLKLLGRKRSDQDRIKIKNSRRKYIFIFKRESEILIVSSISDIPINYGRHNPFYTLINNKNKKNYGWTFVDKIPIEYMKLYKNVEECLIWQQLQN